MAFDRPRHPTRRSGPIALGLLLACALPAAAQEPLLIRIRPRQDADAAAAQAAREALWARRQDHARAVIASVCTGCLAPWTRPAPRAERVTTLVGLETDPGSGASEPAPPPAFPQERP